MQKQLTSENFAALVRTHSVHRVYLMPYTAEDGGGWVLEVDHCDNEQTAKLHTKRGILRVFKTADAAIKAVQEAKFARSVVIVMPESA